MCDSPPGKCGEKWGWGEVGRELENVEKREWREEGCVEQSGYGAASMVVS